MLPEAASLALKLFFPSWNFFDDFVGAPRVEYRTIGRDGAASDWRKLFPGRTTRGLGRVIFNARGNMELLEHSQVEGALYDLLALPAERVQSYTNSSSYPTVTRVVRREIARSGGVAEPDGAESFQYRILAGTDPAGGDLWYLSRTHALD